MPAPRLAIVLGGLGLLVLSGPVLGSPSDDHGCSVHVECSSAMGAALAMAESDDPERHVHLVQDLTAPGFLERLDPRDADRHAGLQVDKVVEALAKNPVASAQRAFIALLKEPLFLEDDDRVTGLIRASSHVRPAPPELVRFWDKFSKHDDGFAPVTVEILIENGSAPALALLERKFTDPTFPKDEKVAWMRTDLLSHRNDVAILGLSERLLRGKLPVRLRPMLVEALFDYLPGDWYKPAAVYSPPRLESASSEALAALLRIGNLALSSVQLNASQRASVKRRVGEINELRKQGHP